MNEPVRARIDGPAGSMPVWVKAKSGNMVVSARRTYSDAQQAFEASLADLLRQPGTRFEIAPTTGFRFNAAKVGGLKSAYIVAFAALGYGYVLTKQLQPIRDQIAAPDQELLSGFWANRPNADRSTRQLGLVRFGDTVSSVAVQMGRHIVFLPMPVKATSTRTSRQRSPRDSSSGSTPRCGSGLPRSCWRLTSCVDGGTVPPTTGQRLAL